MKLKIFVLLIITLFSFYGYASDKKIYTWKDKNGAVVFSDTPKVGAQEVKLTSQILSMPTTDTRVLDESKPVATASYKVVIASPADEETVRENTGSVYVTSRVLPRFENGFKIQLFVDGTPHSKPTDNSTFALRNVERGEHVLQVKLFDQKGKTLSVSPTSVFFMHRASSL